MSKQVIQAKWMPTGPNDNYPELYVNGLILASVSKLDNQRWDVSVNYETAGDDCRSMWIALGAAEARIRAWFADVSPWPIEFDRSEVRQLTP